MGNGDNNSETNILGTNRIMKEERNRNKLDTGRMKRITKGKHGREELDLNTVLTHDKGLRQNYENCNCRVNHTAMPAPTS